jgi:hypothetical protein
LNKIQNKVVSTAYHKWKDVDKKATRRLSKDRNLQGNYLYILDELNTILHILAHALQVDGTDEEKLQGIENQLAGPKNSTRDQQNLKVEIFRYMWNEDDDADEMDHDEIRTGWMSTAAIARYGEDAIAEYNGYRDPNWDQFRLLKTIGDANFQNVSEFLNTVHQKVYFQDLCDEYEILHTVYDIWEWMPEDENEDKLKLIETSRELHGTLTYMAIELNTIARRVIEMSDIHQKIQWQNPDQQLIVDVLSTLDKRLQQDGHEAWLPKVIDMVDRDIKLCNPTLADQVFIDPNNPFTMLSDGAQEMRTSVGKATKKQQQKANARAKAIATVAKQREQEKNASDKAQQSSPTRTDLQTSLQEIIEQKRLATGRDKTVQVQEVGKVVPMQTKQTEEPEDTVMTGQDKTEEQHVPSTQEPPKYVEGRGGQNKIEYQMVVEGAERKDAADMLKVIHEILRRM